MVLAVLMTLLVAGCGSDEDTAVEGGVAEQVMPAPQFDAGTSLARIQQAGKVKIGVKYDQPGFGFQDAQTKQLEGFDIEIAKLVAHGIFGGTVSDSVNKIEFVQAVSRNREAFLQDGTVDMVIATYSINDARDALVDFAGPYYVAHGDVMVRSNEQVVRSVPDLNGKNVCIVRNSTYEQSVRQQAPQAVVVLRDRYAECTDALRDQTVVAIATDNVILAGLAKASTGEFKLLGTSFTDEPYGIGIKEGDSAMRSFLNTRLKQIEDSGQWAKAFETTLGPLGLPTPPPPAINFDTPATETTQAVTPPR